jgi:hypothetical protein
MKIATLTITYRESDLIESVIKNWNGKVAKHLIIETKEPWQGPELPWDTTREICEKYPHVEYVTFTKFRDEAEQRNWGLGKLYDYDYVLVVDADELYTAKDQETILNSIGAEERLVDNTWAYRAGCVRTYFKTPEYVLDPPDTHESVVAVNPKKILFKENRCLDSQYVIPLDITMHHISYMRSDERIRTKFLQFMHYDQAKKDWYTNVWLNWTPDMDDVRGYGKEKSKAVKDPMPKELRELL